MSAVLHAMANREGETIALSQIVRLAGSRAHGIAIFILALPDALPIPIPSFAIVLGVPIVILSAHLAAFGEGATILPRWIDTAVPVRTIAWLDRRVGPTLRCIERHSAHRLPEVARRERLIGSACLALSILLLLPVPLFNVPPALCLVLLAWGLVQKDGAFVLAGLAGTVLVFVVLGWGGAELVDWWRQRG